MKKLLYIVPILVFAMVALTQDAKAQTQTGNASNAITQGATGAVVGAALTSTSTGGDNTSGGGSTTGAGTTTVSALIPVTPVVAFSMSLPSFSPPLTPSMPVIAFETVGQFVAVGDLSVRYYGISIMVSYF